jgi:hypothetical protein
METGGSKNSPLVAKKGKKFKMRKRKFKMRKRKSILF